MKKKGNITAQMRPLVSTMDDCSFVEINPVAAHLTFTLLTELFKRLSMQTILVVFEISILRMAQGVKHRDMPTHRDDRQEGM